MNIETLPINARLLEPAEIAERFVAHQDLLRKVSSHNHVIILGPRGSGKTTMLAMLTRPAQRVWAARNPDTKPLDFLGIFVRADLTWSRQLRYLGRIISPEDRRQLMLALYMNRAFMAMARYTKDLLVQDRALLEQLGRPRSHYELQIIEALRMPCRLPPDIDSLVQMKLELASRNQRLWDAAHTASISELPSEAGLRLDLFQAAASLSEILRDLELAPRVALLLDELELVPREVRNYLKEGLRDSDSEVLLKLSLSPAENTMSDLAPETSGSENDDFIFVDLSYPRRTLGFNFTSSLLVDLSRRRGMRVTSSPQLLGRSRFEPGAAPPRGTSAYGEDSNTLSVFRSLAQLDSTFAAYLAKARIKLDDLTNLTELERAASVRKIRDIVIVREAYWRTSRSGRIQSVPARKPGTDPLGLYPGNASVLALLEGNPRWIVNFISFATGRRPSRSIRTQEQVAALHEVLNGVRSRIAASPVPVDATRDVDPKRGQKILSLIDLVGTYFHKSVHNGPFTGDPVLTFRCDDKLDDETRDLVADGTAHGAFVFIPDERGSHWDPTHGGRFRLAYLVAASHILPPILGREVNLSTIVGRANVTEEIALPEPATLVLFS